VQVPVGIVSADLRAHFLHSFLDLLRGKKRAKRITRHADILCRVAYGGWYVERAPELSAVRNSLW
jgi:hypothetical protein